MSFVSGHDFSRAASCTTYGRALAPERRVGVPGKSVNTGRLTGSNRRSMSALTILQHSRIHSGHMGVFEDRSGLWQINQLDERIGLFSSYDGPSSYRQNTSSPGRAGGSQVGPVDSFLARYGDSALAFDSCLY